MDDETEGMDASYTLTDAADAASALALPPDAAHGELVLAALSEQAREYVHQAKASETLRGYRIDWKDFAGWCDRHGRAALPAAPETVALYLTAHVQTHSTATLQRRLASISQAHAAAGYAESPTKSALVRSVWQGIRREKGVARKGKAPALTADLIRMVHALPSTILGKRDKALLLLGFAGAFRRGELVGLDVSDVAWQEQGIVLTIRRSKTDPEGAGQKVGIPHGAGEDTCPVRALQVWLEAAGIQEGPIFRRVDRHGNVGAGRLDPKGVARVVQRTMAKLGKDPAQFGGHSLRSGLATSAAMAGKSMNAIMKQTRHRSEAMVRLYIREGSLFRDNAAEGLGL